MKQQPSSHKLLRNNQRAAAYQNLLESPLPIWRPIASRDLSKMLGVSLQSLANWRVRGTGPQPEPFRKGGGNRVYYRPDRVLSWLTGYDRAPWEFSRDWLAARGLTVDPSSEASTNWLIEQCDGLL